MKIASIASETAHRGIAVAHVNRPASPSNSVASDKPLSPRAKEKTVPSAERRKTDGRSTRKKIWPQHQALANANAAGVKMLTRWARLPHRAEKNCEATIRSGKSIQTAARVSQLLLGKSKQEKKTRNATSHRAATPISHHDGRDSADAVADSLESTG